MKKYKCFMFKSLEKLKKINKVILYTIIIMFGLMFLNVEVQAVNYPDPPYIITSDTMYVSDNIVWVKEHFEIKAVDGFVISTDAQGTFSSSLDVGKEDSIPLIFLKEQSTGEVIEEGIRITETIRFDSTEPNGTIRLTGNSKENDYDVEYTSYNISTETWFFKDSVSMSISAKDDDLGSGVRSIEYYISSSAINESEIKYVEDWRNLNKGAFEIDKCGKYFVYAKITDNLGSVQYLSTSGFVVYNDSEADTKEVMYWKGTSNSAIASVKLNGNLVNEVSIDNTVLDSGYTVDDNGIITLNASSLENLAIGQHTVTVSYYPLGNEFDLGYAPNNTQFALNINDWGVPVQSNGITYYVQSDGTTSTEIVNDDISWLKEESSGQSFWFGLDNSKGIFEEGSRLMVRLINKESEPDEWNNYFKQIDLASSENIDNEKILILLVGVKNRNGEDYTILPSNVNFYIQYPDDWNSDDINVLFISQNVDESLPCEVTEMSYPGGLDKFANITINHFSHYAIYDNSQQEIVTDNIDKEQENNTVDDGTDKKQDENDKEQKDHEMNENQDNNIADDNENPKTLDNIGNSIMVAIISLIVLAATIIYFKR